ncbi:MAG: hypothetical protein RIE08_13515 [Acidimicrobiales bacterium]
MRRLSLFLAILLTLGLVASACASDLDPALEVGSTEITRDDLDGLVAEARELQDVFVAERGGGGAGLPFIGTPATDLAGSESADLIGGILELYAASEVIDVAFEARNAQIGDDLRAEIGAGIDGAFLANFGLDDELETGLGKVLRDFFVDQEILNASVGFFEPTEAELALLAEAAGAPGPDDPVLLQQVEAAIANGPGSVAVLFASLETDVDLDPRYGEWIPFQLAIFPRGASVGFPPGFTPAAG